MLPMVTMALPTTPFGDNSALRRRYSIQANSQPASDDSDGADDDGPMFTRRLSFARPARRESLRTRTALGTARGGESSAASRRRTRDPTDAAGASVAPDISLQWPWASVDPRGDAPGTPDPCPRILEPPPHTDSPELLRAPPRCESPARDPQRRPTLLSLRRNTSPDPASRASSRAGGPSPGGGGPLSMLGATIFRRPSTRVADVAPPVQPQTAPQPDTDAGSLEEGAPPRDTFLVPPLLAPPAGMHATRASSPARPTSAASGALSPTSRSLPGSRTTFHTGDGMHAAAMYDAFPTAPMSAPLPATPRTRLDAAPGADSIALSVEPAVEQINMFGPLQVTGSYSLSGKISVTLQPDMPACELRQLAVRLCGYSVYVDAAARYSALRFCELSHDLVDLPLVLHRGLGGGTYEAVFDLFAPGWIPASFASRHASTFYVLDAVAHVAELRLAAPPGGGAPGGPPGAQDDLFVSAPGSPDAPRAGVPMSSPSPTGAPVRPVYSAAHLVRVTRSRDLVPIPVAQLAVFTGGDAAPETVTSRNPFLAKARTNPFRAAMPSNPFHGALPGVGAPRGGAPVPGAAAPPPTPPPPDAMPPPPAPPPRVTARVPLRHYTHAPKLRLPRPVTVDGAPTDTLPIRLMLSVPAHVNTDMHGAGDQAPLIFGLQVELDEAWAQAHPQSDLRLYELEAMCAQMEKYSSLLSRSYCTAFALPMDGAGAVPAAELPVVPDAGGDAHEPYNRALVDARVRLEQTGSAPAERRNNVETFRSHTVGPLPQKKAPASDRDAQRKDASREKGKTRTGAPASVSASSSRLLRKKTYTNAFSRLSVLGGVGRRDAEPAQRSDAGTAADADEAAGASEERAPDNPKASYLFDGRDGHGLQLGTKRLRLSFSLPLVPSAHARAAALDMPQLLPDYESPHIRVRHKLKVKLRFALVPTAPGATTAVQSVVMCIPVRFTEQPPREALAQASPVVFPTAARSCVPATGQMSVAVPPALTQATHPAQDVRTDRVPYLPAYTQLFRDDGSRLADESETLPRYPEPEGRGAVQWLSEPFARVAHGWSHADDDFAAHLEQSIALASADVREVKTAAVSSLTETLDAEEDVFPGAARHAMDDLLLDEPAAMRAGDTDLPSGTEIAAALDFGDALVPGLGEVVGDAPATPGEVITRTTNVEPSTVYGG
ncbi:hypothetical protein MSPP1_003674 [Malassezia sp. CBS 17886]|nr:hypothetical protein MSPP1_003674 [Malassezia sp. CBS 17886]